MRETFSGFNFTIQSPVLPATAVLVWPANCTVTLLPGASQPQTGTAVSRCRIALSVKGAANSSCAANRFGAANSAQKTRGSIVFTCF